MDKPAYRGKNAVPIHLCEHHLLKKGREALARDDIKFGDTVRDLLRQSLHSLAEWDALATAVRAEPGWLSANKWVKPWDKRRRLQTARRASLPPVYANGAVEAPIKRVRQVLERRRWTFRNRERMNLLLELVRLAVLRADNASLYAADIRMHIFTVVVACGVWSMGGRPGVGSNRAYGSGPRRSRVTRAGRALASGGLPGLSVLPGRGSDHLAGCQTINCPRELVDEAR